ncbi:FAD/NAD-P-binding domain-containing protein [Mycena albidolilacea]|uniref:FAD/NAD-P-binding domain-containing protein n=1 Tax=Mycena albidolilacea TaxID=1033008 RepID=A0AAD7A3T6_9AGAR|nr:FAD/NAD-P-binding domain-containing protein [Mycena albidolilacea]
MAVDPSQVSSSWIQKFGGALESGDIHATISCIHPKGYFRDLLVFSWNNRCLRGHRELTTYLINGLAKASVTDATLESRPGLTPEYGPLTDKLPLRAVSAGFTFKCAIGVGRGYFSLVSTELGEWKALVVMMALTDIRGHEEIVQEEGVYGGHTHAWGDVLTERRRAIEANPHVLIVGGGQTGLIVAARFKQMNISALVVERNNRVGDNWRSRYPTLTLHTPKKSNTMLYQSFPTSWPVFTPRDKMADWLEQYAQSQDLVVWTNSQPLPQPIYDSLSKRWTVMVDREGERVTLNPVHIVVAGGTLGAPRIPVIRDAEVFAGTTIHASDYRGGKSFSGKRVIVVGAGNTAADICQDLVFNGAQSVTMVQRSTTRITSRTSARVMFDCMYPEELDIDVCDLMAMARPLRLTMKIEKQAREQTLEADKATHRGLREAGLNLETKKTFLTLWYEKRGGFWIDAGCAELIRSGKVKVKQGVEITRFNDQSAVFTDGSSLEADVVIFATSCEGIADTMRTVFGDEALDRVGPVWGIDKEGELRGCYRPTGHPGLWFAAGEFAVSRPFSKQLALEIKAIELGLLKL